MSDLRPMLQRLGLQDECPAIAEADRYSAQRIAEARRCLEGVPQTPGTCVVALGSLGRREASPQSDLDLAFFFDPTRLGRVEADEQRSRAIAALAEGFSIPEKTFRRPIDAEELVQNVGGRRDSNDRLTYRALLLTEGVDLCGDADAALVRDRVFEVYVASHLTRGRFLSLLGNDLHRYYRTVCMDFRYKVEEQDKSWAIRSLKLRHSRKVWHLANLCLLLWGAHACDEHTRVDEVAARLDRPSLVRIEQAMRDFDHAEIVAPLVRAYDGFLDALARAEVRNELEHLAYGKRDQSAAYQALRENAQAVDAACFSIVEVLLAHAPQTLVRFCLL